MKTTLLITIGFLTAKQKRPPLSPPATRGELADKIRINSGIPLLI
ncbi:hypothetical protein [Balneola sp. EhC07]|nr:hypothetical protein [Balneola sp. EhC07]